MLVWLQHMTFSDGDISFFNDATLGIAPNYSTLFEYASRIGLNMPEEMIVPSLRRVHHMQSSGYVRVSEADYDMIIDVARIGARYQPGHAHADTLSFEMAIRGQRLIVNSGISCYGLSAERLRQRGTRAHSTVVCGDVDSSEVWSGFRVARRADPVEPTVSADGKYIACSHNGYKRIRKGPVHRREWFLMDRKVSIRDTLEECEADAIARYHLHPAWQIRSLGDGVECRQNNVTVSLSCGTANFWLEPSSYHPAFNLSLQSQCLCVGVEGLGASLSICWS